MKKLFYSMLLIAGLAIVSCKSEKKHGIEHETHEVAKVEYVCPMECEGEKSYADKDAKCPVCKMKLVPKEESKHEGDKDGEHGSEREHDKHKGEDGDGAHKEGTNHDKDGENHGEEKGHDSDEKH